MKMLQEYFFKTDEISYKIFGEFTLLICETISFEKFSNHPIFKIGIVK